MLRRMHVLLLLIPAVTSLVMAGGSKKNSLPLSVLNARTVVVLVDPQAGVSVNAPLANKTAQDDVEKALMKWGRLKLVIATQTADLVVTVRKGSGKPAQATIGGIPTNNRPVIVQSTDDTIRISAQQGRDSGAPQSGSPDIGPRPQLEVGPTEDMMVVSPGNVDHPLEEPPLWRYTAPGALHSPEVPAVVKFRKAIEETEKRQKNKP